MKIICDIIVKGKMDLFINMGCFMNKSKLKIFIGSIIALNCIIVMEKTHAAMRRPPSPPPTSQPISKIFSDVGRGKTIGEARTFLGQAQNLTLDEANLVIEKAKYLLNNDNYIISSKLNNMLQFVGQDKESLKSRINLLNKNHYLNSFESYNEIKYEGSQDIPSISTLLNNPNFTKLNLVGRSADKALSIIKDRVGSHKYFKSPRVSEEIKKLRYKIKEFRDIILLLEKKHYVLGPEPTHPDTRRRDGTIWLFGYNDTARGNELYIKFLIDNEENEVNVLSFHPTKRPLEYFFKELQ